MTMTELKEFMQANNLKISIVKAWDNDEETAYTYQGYQGDKLLFDMNEFTVRKFQSLASLDMDKADVWDVIEFMHHANWIYDMFMQLRRNSIQPLSRYVKGKQLFEKALNLYGPPVLMIDHGGDARVRIATDAFTIDEDEYNFQLASQTVAEISKDAIIIPSPLGRPANIISACKACFYVHDAHDFIMEIYWPSNATN